MSRDRLRLLGDGALAVVVAAWLTLVELFWLPLRIGGFLVPVSILVAVVGNLLLAWGAHRLSGSRLVGVLPALTWTVICVAAMMRRREGDLVLVGGGALGAVNIVFLLLGVTAASVAVARVMAGPRRPR